MLDSLRSDLKLALRALLRQRLVAFLAVLSLALALAGNSAVFSMLNALLYRPLPIEESERLVLLTRTDDQSIVGLSPDSPANFADLREQVTTLESVAAFQGRYLSLETDDMPVPALALALTADGLEALRVHPALGRLFGAEDDRPGSGRVALVSYDFWQRQLGGTESVVGETLRMSGQTYTLLGVLPEEFEFLDSRFQALIPLALPEARFGDRDTKSLNLFGRLAPGVTLEEARSEIHALGQRLAADHPDANRGYGLQASTIRELLFNDFNRRLMVLLLGGLVFVLLIACVNIANLLLARGQERRGEVALRAALGASRRRIVRQLLMESFLMSMLGAVAGIGLGTLAIRVMRSMYGEMLPRSFAPVMDVRVAAYTLALAAAAGVVFGLVPAVRASSTDLTRVLGEGERAGGGRHRRVLVRALVVAQLALALVMLSGATLMGRSFQQLRRAAPGFEAENLLTFTTNVPSGLYAESDAVADVYRRIVERMRGLPGVRDASLATSLPRSPLNPRVEFSIVGDENDPDAPRRQTIFLTVGDHYLETLGIPLLRGRSFEAGDRDDAPPVVLVNAAFARQYLDGRDPLAQRLHLLDGERQIVGVAGDVLQELLQSGGGAPPVVYLPHAQRPVRTVNVVVRTEGDPHAAFATVRGAMYELEPRIALQTLQTMDEFLDQFLAGVNVINRILLVFGVLALVLAAVGIYGVVAFSVARRRHEIGLRMALGAQPAQVLRQIVREGLLLVGLGFLLGLPGVLLTLRALYRVMADLAAVEPLAMVPPALVLLVVALGGSLVPARRAAGVQPSQALRQN